MPLTHNLGYPRIGPRRELKRLLEDYWAGRVDRATLLAGISELRKARWHEQSETGLDLVPVNDFSLYDHVLDMSALLGVVPERFGATTVDLDVYFRMARGDDAAPACELTKWFDTNYHYLVPEFAADQRFQPAGDHQLFAETTEAMTLGYRVKPVLLGPLTYLWLGKTAGAFDRLDLLDRLVCAYQEILKRLAAQGVEWVQLDEPSLALDLPSGWNAALTRAYRDLAGAPVKLLLAIYYGGLGDRLDAVLQLPVQGLHVDMARAPAELDPLLEAWPADRVLSLGVIDGRNVWRADLDAILDRIEPAYARFDGNLWLAPSCPLLHCPLDVDSETALDPEIRLWLSFARQKLGELGALKLGLERGRRAIAAHRRLALAARESRRQSPHVYRPEVQARLENIDAAMTGCRRAYPRRAEAQARQLGLPLLPATTIGSFPQTPELRRLRADYRAGRMDRASYEQALRAEIENNIRKQERIGLDVLVHGEPERNDMVEYFGELLEGIAVTRHGWVQSYGSRCVKPPIIYGDVQRSAPMTVEWITYAQSLTARPVKGMLTGPVTLLKWSFVRDDQPLERTCMQLALALRDEVRDLEEAGIRIIQMDEPALREGLPLKKAAQPGYLDWAIRAFRIATSGVAETTQIHTHMCYAEFEDILPAITALDADVLTLESARSGGALIGVLERLGYPNAIGPGVWDVHAPRAPSAGEIARQLELALKAIPAERLWINPDCGLKTRAWPEVEAGLRNMLLAARQLRERLGGSLSQTGTEA